MLLALLLVLLLQASCTRASSEPCSTETNCKLPFCNCDSPQVPVDINKHYRLFELPQLVVITIDEDGLDLQSYQVYKKLLASFKNPNKCPIAATFFVSDTHNHTSFCLLRNLYDQRNEIAISTVNNTCPNKRCSTDKYFQPWDYLRWTDQILQMRTRLNRYAGIPKTAITGFRAPILEPAADMHYRIISANKFLYDSSLIMNADDIVWPFTFDFPLNSPLSNNGPIQLYPGLWELPVPTYLDLNNKRDKCLKLWEGHCQYDRTVQGVYRFLRHHFLRAYYNNRAPIVLHFSAGWLKEFETVTQMHSVPNVGYKKPEATRVSVDVKHYHNLDGLIKFINETLMHNKDVYFVTAQQAIEWTKTLARLENEKLDLKQLLTRELFMDKCDKKHATAYDGTCAILKQTKPDYLTNDEADADDTFDLNDNFDKELAKRLQLAGKSSNHVLVELQSEILFLNENVIIFVIALALALLILIVSDKLGLLA